jgi:hypothetical protein
MTTDEKIKTAYDTLTAGRAQTTDGQLTVTNICLEAGISRASFYRSPQATLIRQALADTDTAPQPENEKLRAQLRQLTKTDKALRSDHASEVRELRATVKTYANQIQILTLHLTQLEEDNQRLLHHLEHASDNITALPARP